MKLLHAPHELCMHLMNFVFWVRRCWRNPGIRTRWWSCKRRKQDREVNRHECRYFYHTDEAPTSHQQHLFIKFVTFLQEVNKCCSAVIEVQRRRNGYNIVPIDWSSLYCWALLYTSRKDMSPRTNHSSNVPLVVVDTMLPSVMAPEVWVFLWQTLKFYLVNCSNLKCPLLLWPS